MLSPYNELPDILPLHVSIASDSNQARIIHSTDRNLVMIERDNVETICQYMASLNKQICSPIRFRASIYTYKNILADNLKKYDGDQSIFEPLLHECEYLCELFFSVAGCSEATFNFYRTDKALCTRYHVDMYDIRLLCTYTGKGTEWVDNSTVNRSMLGQSKDNAVIIKPGTIPYFVPLGVPVFLKGEKQGKNHGNGIVHKSPDSELYPQPRIIIRIDSNGM